MGYILAKFSDHKHRLAHWTVSGSVMVVLGIIVHFSGIPFNKNLYSLSYVLLMAGSACILFSVSYAIIDIPQTNIIRKILIPLIALGMNSIAVYAFDHFWNTTFGKYLYYGEEGLTLWHYIYKYVFAWMGTQTGSFFWALSDSLCNTIFALILYKLGIFFKI
jgi:predicted acyltransferase